MRFFIACLFASPPVLLGASDEVVAPWERHSFDLETGKLWQVRDNTSINYELFQTQFSWRSPFVFKFDMDDGSTFVIRNQASLIASWIEKGPEDYYFAISGAPSIEWWNQQNTWSLYFSIGGGIGVVNSTNVPGGQGQDFTLNWFAKAGARHQITENLAVFGGPMFQHMSNGGATTPNPGIDALGFTLGASFSF